MYVNVAYVGIDIEYFALAASSVDVVKLLLVKAP